MYLLAFLFGVVAGAMIQPVIRRLVDGYVVRRSDDVPDEFTGIDDPGR
jgi:hypothetical protein